MLEVGCQHGPGGAGDPGLSAVETRTHFAAWAIVSSPLTLSHDVNNKTIMDAVWPVISNPEVIAVNQAWAGHSGSPFKSSSVTVQLGPVNHAAVTRQMSVEEAAAVGPATAPAWQYYYKPLGKGVAVLLMNNADAATDLTLTFSDVPGVTCKSCHLRDIWAREDLGVFDGSYTAKSVASHDAPFIVISDA